MLYSLRSLRLCGSLAGTLLTATVMGICLVPIRAWARGGGGHGGGSGIHVHTTRPGQSTRRSTPIAPGGAFSSSSNHTPRAIGLRDVRTTSSTHLRAGGSIPYYPTPGRDSAKSDLFDGYMWAGHRHIQQGNYSLASKEFRRALYEKPNDPDALKALQNVQRYMQHRQ